MTPKQLAILCAQLADNKKAQHIEVLDITPNPLADYFVIISGDSDVQIRAIAEAILEGARLKGKKLLTPIEGYKKAEWVLLDFGDVVVHIFYHPIRLFYDLDGFWGDVSKIEWGKGKA